METIVTPSGIALACDSRSEGQIEAALKLLDDRLILTREVYAPTGADFYTVYQWVAGDQPPLHVLYWTEDETRTGRPLPLSTGLIYRVEARKQFAGRNLVAEADEHNEAKKEAMHEEADAELEEEVTSYYRRRLRLGSGANSRRFFNLDKIGKR